MASFPTKTQPWWQYLPLTSIACLFWWMVGLGLWVHFTLVAFNTSQDALEIMQLPLDSGAASQIKRVNASMIATAVVFAVFAVCIHALATWRGLVEVEQDMQGFVEEPKARLTVLLNLGLQWAWWVVILWIIVMIGGYGAFAACIWTARQAVTNVVDLQSQLPAGSVPVADATSCPFVCLSVASSGVLAIVKSSGSTPPCICDAAVLTAAKGSWDKAYRAVPGMYVGLMLIAAYGVVLLAWLAALLVKASMEQDLSVRLGEQGFASSASAPLVGVSMAPRAAASGGRGGAGGSYMPTSSARDRTSSRR